MRQVYASIGADPITNSPAEFNSQMNQEVIKMVKAVKVAGAHLD
jgi:hypothetical protein